MTKELEDLIKATLEDGILEDYEKEALVKRAQKEGMDLVELEIYINAELQKRKRELKEKNEALDAQYEKEKKEAIGPVCPKCGKQVPPLTLKCECGYEFTKGKAASSVKLLIEEIEKIKNTNNENKEQEILDAITLFPVPNTKEDIVEFLALSAPNAKKKGGFLWGTLLGRVIIFLIIMVPIVAYVIMNTDEKNSIGNAVENNLLDVALFVATPLGIALAYVDKASLDWNKKAEIWRNKFDQVLMKGRSLMGDPDFQRQLDYYENKVK